MGKYNSSGWKKIGFPYMYIVDESVEPVQLSKVNFVNFLNGKGSSIIMCTSYFTFNLVDLFSFIQIMCNIFLFKVANFHVSSG